MIKLLPVSHAHKREEGRKEYTPAGEFSNARLQLAEVSKYTQQAVLPTHARKWEVESKSQAGKLTNAYAPVEDRSQVYASRQYVQMHAHR